MVTYIVHVSDGQCCCTLRVADCHIRTRTSFILGIFVLFCFENGTKFVWRVIYSKSEKNLFLDDEEDTHLISNVTTFPLETPTTNNNYSSYV